MKSICMASCALALFAATALAQSYSDRFSYPDGTTVPGWTEHRGEWFIQGGKLYVTSLTVFPVHGFITKDGYRLKDSVTELTVSYYGSVSTIQSGGLLARANNAANHSNIVFCKVQDSSLQSLPAGFDSLWVYEYGQNITWASSGIAPIIQACRLRFVVVDNTATMLMDTDLDGDWDVSTQHTLSTELAAGDTGCMAGHLPQVPRSSALDDFALFDAVLTSTGTAAPGSTLTLNLRGRKAGAGYQVACSLSNFPGIPLGARRIPLTYDSLMVASLLAPAVFQGFVGGLDATATGTARINIPNNAALTGFKFYAGFVELAGGAPMGINSISNDLPITIS